MSTETVETGQEPATSPVQSASKDALVSTLSDLQKAFPVDEEETYRIYFRDDHYMLARAITDAAQVFSLLRHTSTVQNSLVEGMHPLCPGKMFSIEVANAIAMCESVITTPKLTIAEWAELSRTHGFILLSLRSAIKEQMGLEAPRRERDKIDAKKKS